MKNTFIEIPQSDFPIGNLGKGKVSHYIILLLKALWASPKVMLYITSRPVRSLENTVKICTIQNQYIYACKPV